MLSSYSVKKPMTVVVVIIAVIILSVVSFLNMSADLLPSLDFPYIIVYTSYAGASPEKVEVSVTKPLEQTLSTANGMKKMSSVSSEGVSMIIMEFEQDTNMDSSMIEVSNQIDLVAGMFEDEVTAPLLMKLNPDMMPVMVASVDSADMELTELSALVNETVLPTFERIDGVGSVTATGLLEEQVHVTPDQSKIDALNDKVLAGVDSELADAQSDLRDSQQKIDDGFDELADGKDGIKDGKASLKSGEKQLRTKRDEIYDQLTQAGVKVDSLSAQLNALLANEQTYTAQKTAFEKEKAGYEAAAKQLAEVIDILDPIIAALPSGTTIEELKAMLPDGFTLPDLPSSVKTADQVIPALEAQIDTMQERVGDIDTELKNLETKLETAKAMKSTLQKSLKEAEAAYAKLEKAKLEATDELARAGAKIDSGKSALDSAQKQLYATEEQLGTSQEQLDDAWEQFYEARDDAYKAADLDGIITPDTISSLLAAQNFSMPAGSIEDDGLTYTVKVGDKFENLDALKQSMLFNIDVDGVGEVKLADVATVEMADNSVESYARVNGNDSIVLTFQASSTASTAVVTEKIRKAAESLEAGNTGFRFVALMDQGVYIDTVTGSVASNLLWGGLLAILILIVFLRDIKPTVIIAFSIPISLVFAIVMMYFAGVSINIISLSGLALGVGMLVDNSIVVIENIYRMRSLGVSARDAAIDGAKQMTGAITASTLTTVCVFLPIVFATGITKQLFADMGLTIGFSLFASLIVALTLVPAMSSRMLRADVKAVTKEKGFGKFLEAYGRALGFVLRHKVWAICLSALLLVASVYFVSNMGMSFIPKSDSQQMTVTMKMPTGSTEDQGWAMTDDVVEALLKFDEVDTVGAMEAQSFGMQTAGSYSMYIVLKEDRQRTSQELAEEMGKALEGMDCEISVSSSNMDMSALGGSGLSVEIKGAEIETLRSLAAKTAKLVTATEGVKNVDNGLGEKAMDTRITVDKEKAMEYNLTVAQVYSAVASAVKSERTATTLTVGADEYPVILVTAQDQVVNNENIGSVKVTGTKDKKSYDVKLSDIAQITQEETLSSIQHDNQTRYITVSAEVDEQHNITLLSRELQKELDKLDVPEGYSVEIGGETETIQQAFSDLLLMMLLAVALIYLIMVAQFQSLLSPFIVMFTIPLAFTGGLLALIIAGKELSIVAMLGFLVLSGVIVNNGIVFVDTVNKLREGGMERREALITAGKTRMRPILMTALTTILAMSTMAFGIGEGADMVQPMAIVTIGGLIYATVMTLFIVPSMYDGMHRDRKKKRRKQKNEIQI